MGSFGGSAGSRSAQSSAKDAWKMGQQGYWEQGFRLDQDPFAKAGLRGMKFQAGQDWMGMGRALGNQQSDIASQGLQDALAARGGGNLSSALGMGAQARVGGALQGMQMGAGLKGQFLQQLLGGAQAQLGLQNQLYGMMTGVGGAQIGAGAQVQSAQTGAMANMISTLMQQIGGTGGGGGFGGGGGGEGKYGEGGSGYIPFY